MAATPQSTRSPDGRRKKRPGLEEQKRGILEAAVVLFRQYGSRAVSISQICQQAGISRPTFYRCFPDKETLVDAIYQEAVNRPVQEFMLRGLSGKALDGEKVHAALDQLFDTIFDNADFAELVFMEANDPASPACAIVDEAFSGFAGVMAEGIRKRRGEENSPVFLKALMAACQWIVHDAIRKGLNESRRNEAKTAAWELVRRALYPGT